MAASMKLVEESYRLKLCAGNDPSDFSGELIAARPDSAAFQAILQSSHPYCVSTECREWFTAGKQSAGEQERLRIAVDAPFPVSCSIEEFLPDDDEIPKADLLLNQSVRESPPDLPTAVWVEIEISEDAAAGDYSVIVFLYSSMPLQNELLLQQNTLSLHVGNAVCPPPERRRFQLDLWQHCSNIARKHDVRLWSDGHFAVLKKYAESLAALGQKSITVVASQIPWRGQDGAVDHRFGGNLFEYSMIPIKKTPSGRFSFDYSIMQRYIDTCTEAGITGDIDVFGLINVWRNGQCPQEHLCPDYPEWILLRYYDEADGCQKYITEGNEIRAYIQSLEQYFIATNQIGRVKIVADEPVDLELYRQSLNIFYETAPAFRFKTAINHAEFISEFQDSIDVFVPQLRCAVSESEPLRQYRAMHPEKKFLWYVCSGTGYPNTFLRSMLLESRLIGILTALFGYDGFLRWNYTAWPDHPRHDIRYSAFEAGDTNFVYPAHDGSVLYSLRYKNLQRGITDYELLMQVKKKFGSQSFFQLLSTVIRTTNIQDFGRKEEKLPRSRLFSIDWNEYNKMKRSLLDMLDGTNAV